LSGFSNITDLYKNHSAVEKLIELVINKSSDKQLIALKGISGSISSLLLAALFQKVCSNLLCIFPDKESAAYFHSDLISFMSQSNILFLPSSYKKKLKHYEADNAQMVIRTDTLNRIKENKQKYVTITYSEAISEKSLAPSQIENNSLEIHKNEKISPKFLEEVLFEYQFEYTDFVYKPGQFAIRGSIVDIFSFASEHPVRIDFFGNEVDSIRFFNINDQLSIQVVDKVIITPDFQTICSESIISSIFDFYKEQPLLFIDETKAILNNIDNFFDSPKKGREVYGEIKDEERDFFFNSEQTNNVINNFSIIETGISTYFTHNTLVELNTFPQPIFNKQFELLASDMANNKDKGYVNYLMSENNIQVSRLNTIFSDLGYDNLFIHFPASLHKGFGDNELKLVFYSDNQIFERYQKYKIREDFVKNESISLNEFLALNPGDYIVHIDHGIGIFGGLEKVELNGKQLEQIRLVYKDKDILYVNLQNLHKISKYKSSNAEAPKLNKLGSGAWLQLKNRTKSKLKDIAKDLIALYAKRLEQPGFAFSDDTYMQHELEASFMYDDTPDQEKTTKEVKADMEKTVPMDRLVCGDVGFGKTEIAVRAAFKAVADSKQVALLVPTTILALQHFYTFTERLRAFPCSIEHISRLKTSREQKQILEKLEDGKIDILIGTHKLLSNNIKFKDLGLLIIDEEQKFGVAAKEKLRELRVNIDTLTLTATPIPRTLQFSLMGARDLSTINTPPPNRQPVVTEIHSFTDEIIREAIVNELERKGQIFFVHNRVHNIIKIKERINKACPQARVVIAHGQMKPNELENTLLSFIDGSYDVLLSTTIIENGLDIPNANTIIINDAHNFGLSDLHQLRGRVGRSNKKAYCFLLTNDIHTLTSDARRRLRAITEFNDLGSGINIAMQDLDIRGAGNLLGAEQSGFIADIGFETYKKILKQAIDELKESEFVDLFNKNESSNDILSRYVSECSVETDMPLFIPDNYITNISERLKTYREIAELEDSNSILSFSKKLSDRFGTIPPETIALLEIGPLRKIARKLGYERVLLKNKKMICFFISDKESPYFQSVIFQNILNWVLNNRMGANLKEANNRLSLHIEGIVSVKQACNFLEELKELIT